MEFFFMPGHHHVVQAPLNERAKEKQKRLWTSLEKAIK